MIVFLGLVAGFVDIGAKWMSHWRTGVCAPALWLNREQCCWGSRDVEFDRVHNELCEHVRFLRRNDSLLKFII